MNRRVEIRVVKAMSDNMQSSPIVTDSSGDRFDAIMVTQRAQEQAKVRYCDTIYRLGGVVMRISRAASLVYKSARRDEGDCGRVKCNDSATQSAGSVAYTALFECIYKDTVTGIIGSGPRPCACGPKQMQVRTA